MELIWLLSSSVRIVVYFYSPVQRKSMRRKGAHLLGSAIFGMGMDEDVKRTFQPAFEKRLEKEMEKKTEKVFN